MNWRHRSRTLPYAACAFACIIVDLLYFLPRLLFPDEHRFLDSAARLIASGQFWSNGSRAWEMPGTALFFAPAVWLFGPHEAIIPIRLTQAALLLVQCGLIGLIARRLFRNPTASLLASLVAALYPFLLFYQGLLLSETLFNTLFLAGIAALFWWRDRGSQIDGALVAASFLFAAATLTKATLTVMPPLLLAATAWLSGVNWRRVIAILIAASSLYAAFLSPWWIRNAMLFHAFVPFTTGSAENLYLGNNPHNPNGGIDWANDAEPGVVARINALPSELSRQRAYKEAALQYIENNPAAFIRAAAQKFVRFWNIVPNAAEFHGGLYAVTSAASFGPILLLALIAAIRRRRQWRLLAPLYLIIGYFTFVHVVTIASLRYRLPIEPLLIVLAAEPLAAFLNVLRPAPSHRTGMVDDAPVQ
jgi:hypothetical protein